MTIKELFAPSDMTVGKPWEKIVAFTIPMLIGNIAQQLYNTVDSIVIGKYVGDNALAAVGSASPILNLLLVLFVGISVGAGVMVSQYFGARQRKELSMTIGNCVTLTAISSIIIMILGAVLSRPLLEMLKTPDSIIDWCTSYLVILMVGRNCLRNHGRVCNSGNAHVELGNEYNIQYNVDDRCHQQINQRRNRIAESAKDTT